MYESSRNFKNKYINYFKRDNFVVMKFFERILLSNVI